MCDCPFCKESFFPYRKKLGVNIEESIIYQDENIFVTPDISPIGEGHFLIITWDHYCNFACAPQTVRDSVKKAIKFISEKVYEGDNFLLFEHGSTNLKKSGNSIDHAHIHTVKGAYSLSAEVEKQGLYSEFINISLDDYANDYSQKAYVWILEGKNSSFFTNPNIPSQYLRKVFKEKYPTATSYSFDWRKEHTTNESLTGYFNNLKYAKKINE